MATIRAPRFSDTPAVYRICFETGPDAGDAAATPELLGHVYAGPYLAAVPEWCRVVVDEQGVAGYLLAAPDTEAFERWAAAEWYPPLAAEHPVDEAGSPADRRIAAVFAAPPRTPGVLLGQYPAHLHIDFLLRARGAGHARALIDDLVDRLGAAGVPGVHLGVSPRNTNAIGLYAHLGFTELERHDDVVWMGRSTGAADDGL